MVTGGGGEELADGFGGVGGFLGRGVLGGGGGGGRGMFKGIVLSFNRSSVRLILNVVGLS